MIHVVIPTLLIVYHKGKVYHKRKMLNVKHYCSFSIYKQYK